MTLARRIVSEGLGTAFLLAVVVGSGIMAERLSGGNVALALLANAIATGAGLVALILMFGTVSGAHFNPVVTLSEAWQKNIPASEVLPYIAVQVVGAFAGVAAAHLMFGDPVFFASEHVRTGPEQWWSEFVATFGLIAVIIGCSRSRPSVTPFAVATYITAAYSGSLHRRRLPIRQSHLRVVRLTPLREFARLMRQDLSSRSCSAPQWPRWYSAGSIRPRRPTRRSPARSRQATLRRQPTPIQPRRQRQHSRSIHMDSAIPNIKITQLDIPTMDKLAQQGDLAHPPRILMLYGSLRERSFSRFLTYEAARILEHFGAEVKIFDPTELPMAGSVPETHPKVAELRALSLWSEGQVWCSPKRHGAITAVMKNQIDWIPLEQGSLRPSQGRTLAVMQVCGGSQSFNVSTLCACLADGYQKDIEDLGMAKNPLAAKGLRASPAPPADA